MHALKTYGLVEMLMFVVLLVVAYVHVWKGGRWNRGEAGLELAAVRCGPRAERPADDGRQGRRLGAVQLDLAGRLRPRLLRDRDDGDCRRPRYDIARFGAEVFRASPRQSDLMIVSGRVSQKMAPPLRQVYDQMPEPKWVIAMGACSSSAAVMFDNYAILQGVDKIVPVDVYVPGLPAAARGGARRLLAAPEEDPREASRRRTSWRSRRRDGGAAALRR